MISSLLLLLFLVGILILLYLGKQNFIFTVYGRIKRATPAQMNINSFARKGPRSKNPKKTYAFSEMNAVSMTHRYRGRFDTTVLRWDTGPILVALIERKYPRSVLPQTAKPEDVFQASLYALALKEKGISCSSSQLLTIYCLQDAATRCLKKQGGLDCLRCKEGRVFKTRFNEKKTLKQLDRLDEVWYESRKPKPNSTQLNCRVCPYSKKRKCEHSAV